MCDVFGQVQRPPESLDRGPMIAVSLVNPAQVVVRVRQILPGPGFFIKGDEFSIVRDRCFDIVEGGGGVGDFGQKVGQLFLIQTLSVCVQSQSVIRESLLLSLRLRQGFAGVQAEPV